MQLKEINRNKITEHKRRLEKHKKVIESDVSNSNVPSSNSNMAVVPSAVRLVRSPTAGARATVGVSRLAASSASLRLAQQTQSAMLSKEVMTQEKTANDNGVIKKKIAKKKIIDKKAMNDRHKAIAEKLMDDVREGNINIGRNLKEYPEESKVVITKEERADRFKRLHTMVQDMIKKRNE